jgi:hypothetical protein
MCLLPPWRLTHARGRFEYVAENRQFPATLARGSRQVRGHAAARGKEVLSRLNAYMHRREISRRPGEPTLRVGIGMHLWEGERNVQQVRRRADCTSLTFGSVTDRHIGATA